MSLIRKQVVAGVRVGQLFSVSRTFAEEDVTRFADISRDYNPVHCDERFAKIKGYRNTICHGLFVASMLTEIGGQLGWLATGMSLKFKKPVYSGETIRCDFTITSISVTGHAEADVMFTNEDGGVVIEAVIAGILPGSEELDVVQQMLDAGDPTNGAGG